MCAILRRARRPMEVGVAHSSSDVCHDDDDGDGDGDGDDDNRFSWCVCCVRAHTGERVSVWLTICVSVCLLVCLRVSVCVYV